MHACDWELFLAAYMWLVHKLSLCIFIYLNAILLLVRHVNDSLSIDVYMHDPEILYSYIHILDFTTDADSKHSQYLEDRSKLLHQCKVRGWAFSSINKTSIQWSLLQLDFAKSVMDNAEMATTYHQLQCEFIKVKTQALKVIESKLKLETSLRDHQQVHKYWYLALHTQSYDTHTDVKTK